MAQLLESFEETLQPHFPKERAGDVQAFKGLARAKLQALAVDAIDVMSLEGFEHNALAQELRDGLQPEGRP